MTLSMSVDIADRDIIKMIEEFMANRHLDISFMCLERESGIINGIFSDDGLFLRQLILDGHWDDALEFLQPLEGVDGFDRKRCQYLIYKHKYLELLCIKHDPGPLQNHEFTLDEVIACLTELEVLCTDRKEYDNFCFLLTLPSITADKAYENWNPSSARINCFNELYPLVKKFVGLEKRAPPNSSSKQDRLVNLLTKGILYEMCVELCTARACGAGDNVTVNHPLGGTPCSDADLSLISWLQKVPVGTFACPFEKKALKLKLEKLEKPLLEAVWSEQLLSTPIKPKQFPHTSIPARTRSSQLVSQSMMAMYDGLSSNLYLPHGIGSSMSEPRSRHVSGSPHLSRSFAHSPTTKFLLTNSYRSDRKTNPMSQSMERLFNMADRSSPRIHSSSPLVRDEAKKSSTRPEVISPPAFTDISPCFSASQVNSPKETAVNSEQQSPLQQVQHPQHSPQQPQSKQSEVQQSQLRQSEVQHTQLSQSPHHPQQTQLKQSQSPHHPQQTQLKQSQSPHHPQQTQLKQSQLQHSQPHAQQSQNSLQTADTGLVQVESSHLNQRNTSPVGNLSSTYYLPPDQSQSSASHLGESSNYAGNSQHKQGIPQKPDLLQHDVNDCPTAARTETRDSVTGGVRASQDLYAQFQEQKRRIEEEMKRIEERDEEWRRIQEGQDSAPIPKLELDQTETSFQSPDLSSQAPPCDVSDVSNEVNLINEEVTIKQFVAVETLEEQGPVRAVAFHPAGECYAVGSNTKILRVCQYPDMSKVTTSYHTATRKPKILAKKVKHHAGSIYCVAWNTLGTVIATGSNDHTVKCVQWLGDQNVFGSEKSLSVHDGTVRDVSFLSTDQLLSAGAGDCTVCLTDIASGSVVRRYKGHTGHVLSLFPHRESQKFVSGGQDKKALLWDTRMSVPVQTYQSAGSLADSAFASVCLDPSPRVLASGHDNSYCSLYDLRQGRLLQAWRPHTDEVRSARFNSDATYFLSGSYDTTVKLMDMQGDITQPLKTVQVAEHMDKVIQCRWHPLLPSFITSSADKTVTCWAIQIDD